MATGGRTLLAAGITLGLVLAVLPPAVAQGDRSGRTLSGEVAKKIRQAGSDDLVPLIVQTRQEPSPAHLARMHGRGGVLKTRHEAVRGYSARVPAGQIEALADDPEVERISLDAPVKTHLDVAFRAVHGEAAAVTSGGLSGKGIGVAVIDTGVQGHLDLKRPKGSPQVIEVEIVGREAGLADYFGHGTHVAGVINGNGYASSDRVSFRTFKGLAPETQIISIRALDADGSGYTSDIISGIDWAIRYRTSHNIRVLNLSLGHPVFESYATDPLCRAVRAAHDAGIVVVVAAGNDGGVDSGFGTITSPANEPSAITVGAMDDDNTVTTTDDVLAWYSSKGPSLVDYVAKPDLVAPGTWIVSLRAPGSWLDANHHDLTLQIGDYKNDSRNALRDGDYYTLSGTSMAAPFVSAAAALMIQQEPGLNPGTVKARLMKSTVKDDLLVFETGAGYLDVEAALKATGYVKLALSPTAILASDGYVYVEDTAIIWGGGSSWGLGFIWGDKKGNARSIIWTEVSEEVLSAYGSIWGRGGHKSIVENGQVTGSGLIWSGGGSILSSTTGTVDMLGAVWAGGGSGGKK
jgi:serine protease AprX